jgi:hypothetical protein
VKQQSAKQFFSTPAGKLSLAIIAMVVCWTVLIVYLSNTSTGGTWFPTEVDMNRVRQDIKKDTNTLATEQANKQAYDALEDQYEDSLATYWNADRDGEPETELRNLVNDAATRAGANLQNLGSVRTSSINSELSYADLDFTVVDEYLKVINFIAEVEKSTPRLSWRRVEIRLEPTRARAVTGPAANRPGAAATTTTSTPAQTFRATGQVRVIKYSPTGAAKSATAAKTSTTTTTASKPAATSTTTPAVTGPAAQATAPVAAAPAGTPANPEPAANATSNKENGK